MQLLIASCDLETIRCTSGMYVGTYTLIRIASHSDYLEKGSPKDDMIRPRSLFCCRYLNHECGMGALGLSLRESGGQDI